MAGIWKQNQDVKEHPNRNNFDLRYQNHLTMKMGGLYPFMAKECVPGDTFEIDTAYGLKFMPLVFPVQSSMKAYVYYFYVPNRILWPNFKNFVSGLEEHVHPYIDQPSSWFKTGSLADYLDIPTTLVSTQSRMVVGDSQTTGFTTGRPRSIWNPADGTWRVDNSDVRTNVIYSFDIGSFVDPLDPPVFRNMDWITSSWKPIYFFIDNNYSMTVNRALFYLFDVPIRKLTSEGKMRFELGVPATAGTQIKGRVGFVANPKTINRVMANDWESFAHNHGFVTDGRWSIGPEQSRFIGFTHNNDNDVIGQISADGCYLEISMSTIQQYAPNLIPCVNDAIEGLDNLDIPSDLRGISWDVNICLTFTATQAATLGFPGTAHARIYKDRNNYFTGRVMYPAFGEMVADSDALNPFGNDHSDKSEDIHVNALPFRAYEAIYWSYFANTQNQPFFVDGVQQFNRYNTTTDDGADSTDYHLMFRNYELDFLTSCLPSPQFGPAPQVGINTVTDTITVSDENGITTAKYTAEDGQIVDVAITSPVASIDHARTLLNIAQLGFSINDFRSANAMQRFLETTLRLGYKYADFIAGHFGKGPSHMELDMPIFIGGSTQPVNVDMIQNMSAGESNMPLGSFAGTASCFGSSKHKVHHYCDDYGWIIGIISVVPTPAYSQLLPKHWLKSSQFDYMFPEFSQLGYQPISYKEVTPIQSYQNWLLNGGDSGLTLSRTFGYQRPNYDLVGFTDQVHGLFRTDLRSYLINRVFADEPSLGDEFLKINPSEINDIFAEVDPGADTIVGQIVVDIKAKRPVPRITIPSLGR